MPRGQDTRNHPNRRVGRSDLPRLSSALANVMNDSLDINRMDFEDDHDEGYEDFLMERPMANYMSGDVYRRGVDESDASYALQRYREDRESGKYDLTGERDDIKDAYRNRNNY